MKNVSAGVGALAFAILTFVAAIIESGPGGTYKSFSGADASRAFVTTCFEEDRTSDLRGAELIEAILT